MPANHPTDGYTSLLVKSEGGEAEEIVDEESGILISTMLRQYFMGLRTVGQWKYLSARWCSVASNTSTPFSPDGRPAGDERKKSSAPTRNPAEQADSETSGKSWTAFLQSRLGLDKAPINDDTDTDGEEEEEEEEEEVDDQDRVDWEILLMRKFWARWARKAGVQGSVCDSLREGEMSVDWTRTIAPVLEGRIKMVQG